MEKLKNQKHQNNRLKKNHRTQPAMNHQQIKRFRKRKFEKNPYCPQCGVLMILPESVEGYPDKIKKYPNNTVTYEHSHSRLNPNRGERAINGILCWKCNGENGYKDEKKYLFSKEKV